MTYWSRFNFPMPSSSCPCCTPLSTGEELSAGGAYYWWSAILFAERLRRMPLIRTARVSSRSAAFVPAPLLHVATLGLVGMACAC
jgi:hypothetical protein